MSTNIQQQLLHYYNKDTKRQHTKQNRSCGWVKVKLFSNHCFHPIKNSRSSIKQTNPAFLSFFTVWVLWSENLNHMLMVMKINKQNNCADTEHKPQQPAVHMSLLYAHRHTPLYIQTSCMQENQTGHVLSPRTSVCREAPSSYCCGFAGLKAGLSAQRSSFCWRNGRSGKSGISSSETDQHCGRTAWGRRSSLRAPAQTRMGDLWSRICCEKEHKLCFKFVWLWIIFFFKEAVNKFTVPFCALAWCTEMCIS